MEIKRTSQLIGHCGPCSIAIMLSVYGCKACQIEIAEKAGVSSTIMVDGSRMDQLALAVEKLYPHYIVLGKFFCSEADIDLIINKFNLPIGVEWQGVFRDENDCLFEIGHYSILTSYSDHEDQLGILDPDDTGFYVKGEIPKVEFLSRWWEDNTMEDGNRYRTYKFSFIIALKSKISIFQEYGFMPVTHDFIMHSSNSP